MSSVVIAVYRPDGSGRVDGFQIVDAPTPTAAAVARRGAPGEEWAAFELPPATHRARADGSAETKG